jgi:hypothetical protein
VRTPAEVEHLRFLEETAPDLSGNPPSFIIPPSKKPVDPLRGILRRLFPSELIRKWAGYDR